MRAARAIVVQLELDADVIEASVRTADGLIVGTLAPRSGLDEAIRSRLDMVVVNAAEAAAILGRVQPSATLAQARSDARALREWGPRSAIVTVGAQGAVYASPEGHGSVTAPPAVVVDTTGAGDAFLAAVVLAIVRGSSLRDAVTVGVVEGAAAVGRIGAAPHPGTRG